MKQTIDNSLPVLIDYKTGKDLRNATDEELAESKDAGHEGVITTADCGDCFVRE